MKYVYVNILYNHFKVWGFDCFQNNETGQCEVITYYGKIGLPMDKLRKCRKFFLNYGLAYDYVMAKMKEKSAKGYIRMLNSKYFSFIYDEKPLSELIKAIESH